MVENFNGGKRRNLWHTIANHHGIWLLLKVLSISPADVTAILPSKFGTPFHRPPRFVSDVMWPIYMNTNNESRKQRNCFEKIVFMETNSSPYWSLRCIHQKCSAGSPYMKMHRQFHNEARGAALSILGMEQNGTSTGQEVGMQQHPKKEVCYMSRRLRPQRKRHFSPSFEAYLDKRLDDWANRHGKEIEFHRLEFDEMTPFSMQVELSSQCNLLFGTHGAGLGHMLWMESGSQIVEIGNHMTCETYYKSMASWYGHEYTCFSEVDGHEIRHDKNQVYHSLNVTLLLNVLDDMVR